MLRDRSGPVSSISYDEYQRRKRAADYPSFETDTEVFGSWLSSLTGIHINPLNLGATKIDVGQLLKTAAIAAGVVIAGPAVAALAAKATPAIISGLQAGGSAAVGALKALGAPPTPSTVSFPPLPGSTPIAPVSTVAPLPVIQAANIVGPMPPPVGTSISPVVLAGAAVLAVVLLSQHGGRR